MAVHYLTALGQHGKVAAVGTVLSILGVAAGALAASHFGLVGFAKCLAVAVMLKVPYRVWIASRTMGLPVSKYISEALWPAAPCAIIQLVAMMYVAAHWGTDTWAGLFRSGFTGAIIYPLAFIILSRKEDQQVLRRLIQHLRPAGVRPPATS